jgi:hypothetical protein
MKVIKLKRHDEPMFHHIFCPNCHRWLTGQEWGCFFCCQCGISLDWDEKPREKFQQYSISSNLYDADKECENSLRKEDNL